MAKTTKTVNIRLRDEIAEEAWKHVKDHKKASLNALVNDIVADAISVNHRPWMPPGLTPLAQELRDAVGSGGLWAFVMGLGESKREVVVGRVTSWTPVVVRVELYDCPCVGGMFGGSSGRYLALSEMATWLQIEVTDQHHARSASLESVLGAGKAPPERMACIDVLAEFPSHSNPGEYGGMFGYDPKRGLLFEEQATVRRGEILESQQLLSVLPVVGVPPVVGAPFVAYVKGGCIEAVRLTPLGRDRFYRISGIRARYAPSTCGHAPGSLQMIGFKIGGGVNLLPSDKEGLYESKIYPLSNSWTEVGALELRDFPILRYPNSVEVDLKNTSDLEIGVEVEILVTEIQQSEPHR